MALNKIDQYIADQLPAFQRPLQELRKIIHALLPGATECISYGMPTFQVDGKSIVGFAGFKKHMSFFPYSGSILGYFSDEIRGFTHTKSSLHFTPENPIPESLIKEIILKKLETIEKV